MMDKMGKNKGEGGLFVPAGVQNQEINIWRQRPIFPEK